MSRDERFRPTSVNWQAGWPAVVSETFFHDIFMGTAELIPRNHAEFEVFSVANQLPHWETMRSQAFETVNYRNLRPMMSFYLQTHSSIRDRSARGTGLKALNAGNRRAVLLKPEQLELKSIKGRASDVAHRASMTHEQRDTYCARDRGAGLRPSGQHRLCTWFTSGSYRA